MGPLYSALLHSHELFITLYVIVFIVKLILLLINNTESLAIFRKKTKVIGEMILPTLFLGTGIALAIISKTGFSNNWFLIKMCLIALSIGTGIYTFNKNSKFMGILTFLIFLYVILLSYMKDPYLKKPEKPEISGIVTDSSSAGYNEIKYGLYIYVNSGCNSCHGPDGKLGNHGAANLSISVLDDQALKNIITNGRGKIMKGFGNKLKPEEIHAVSAYVKSLRRH